MIRWATDWDCKEETSFWYIIKDSYQGMEELKSKTRQQIRKGLKKTSVEKVDIEYLAVHGHECYYEALKHYGEDTKGITKEAYYDHIISQKDDADWDVWVIKNNDDGKVIAYSLNAIYGQECRLVAGKFHPDHFKQYPSEVLFHSMHDYYFGQRAIAYMNDGARSMAHNTKIQDYLEYKFNYRKAYCRLNVEYAPLLRMLVSALYPFRGLIYIIKNQSFSKLSIILKHEEIVRKDKDRK